MSPLRIHGLVFSLLALLAAAAAVLLPRMSPREELLVFAVLVAVLGVPHGALDPIFARQLYGIGSPRGWIAFAVCYVALGAMVAGLWWLAPGVLLMLFLAACVALKIFIARQKAAQASPEINEIKILVPYKINEIDENKNGAKINRIVNYLAIHYAEPELSVQDLEKSLGITAREIGSLIKDELHSSFKSYLNMIRLTEIKRLLVETDLSISDIAYRTGYNNISHFNRVFKAESGVSPKEFRATNH